MTKRLPGDKRKKTIIRAAIAVFSESNYRVAKIADVAGYAGVTEPVVYRHFASKMDLFLEVLLVMGRRTVERLLEASSNEPNSFKVLESAIWGYISSMDTYRRELKIFFQAISEIDNEKVRGVLQGIYQNYANCFREILKKGVEDGFIDGRVNIDDEGWIVTGHLIQLSTYSVLGLFDQERTTRFICQYINDLRVKEKEVFADRNE